jgi:hypothetical protein
VVAPGGLPAKCYASESPGKRIQLTLGAGRMDTTLKLDGDKADLELSSVSLAASYPIGEKTTLRGGIGSILDGELRPESGTVHEFEPGGLAFAGLNYNSSEGQGSKPSLDLSAQFGVTWAETVEQGTDLRADYFAADFRLGAQTTWTVGSRFFPYLAARVFGGPVSWEYEGESLTGSDVHHYQVAAGAAVSLGPAVLFAEWAPLGEQALSAGIGSAW